MKKDKKEYNSEDVEEILEENLNQMPETENESATEDEAETQNSVQEEDVIENLQQEISHLKDESLRAYAELENTKKRCAQEIQKNSKYAVSSFAKEILGVADNLHRALLAAAETQSEECTQLKKGVELIESELSKVLEKFGVTKMEPMGKVFDPAFHRVVQEVEDKEKAAGTVIAELQTGYMINDRILREAMVVVSK